jgi:acyl carrier protein
MTLVHRVGTVFSQTFGVGSDSFSPDTVPESVPNWDSVGHMNLVAGLETEFGLQFEVDEIMEMSSGRRIIEILQARGIGE